MTVSERIVSPILQFVLLIVPVVMSGFFLVYSLVGLMLDGKDKFNWSLEATDVATMVGGGIAAFSAGVLIYAKIKGLGKFHPLSISGMGHLALALMLTAIVFIIVKL